MTGTIGSQVFGPWYDVIGAALMSGMFFYLASAQATFSLSAKQRMPAFLNRRTCIALGLCAAAVAVFNGAKISSTSRGLPAATVTAFGAAPQWQVIYTGDEGETLSIDLETIVRNGDTVGYSERLAYKTPTAHPVTGTMASATARLLVNCAERTRVLEEYVVVRSDGSTVFQDKSGVPPVLPLSTNPSQPDYISSNYLCGPREAASPSAH